MDFSGISSIIGKAWSNVISGADLTFKLGLEAVGNFLKQRIVNQGSQNQQQKTELQSDKLFVAPGRPKITDSNLL